MVEQNKDQKERRDFVRKAVYAAPAIMTLQAVSAVAKAGSVKDAASAKQQKWPQGKGADKDTPSRGKGADMRQFGHTQGVAKGKRENR